MIELVAGVVARPIPIPMTRNVPISSQSEESVAQASVAQTSEPMITTKPSAAVRRAPILPSRAALGMAATMMPRIRGTKVTPALSGEKPRIACV